MNRDEDMLESLGWLVSYAMSAVGVVGVIAALVFGYLP